MSPAPRGRRGSRRARRGALLACGVALLACGAALLAGCAAPAPQEPDLPPVAGALRDLRAIFGEGVLGDGTPVVVAAVDSLTATGISWTPNGEPARSLAWRDVEDVQSQRHDEKPARPETVYLYLARGSRSIATAEPVRPPLSDAAIVRCYVALRDRPSGSRARLVRALALLWRHPAPPASAGEGVRAAPAAAIATPTSSTSASDAARVQARLEQLKAWHASGLIDDEVYREEQRRALAGF